MLDQLSGRFQQIFHTLCGRGVLVEKHLREAQIALRSALQAADVHHAVVDRFIAEVDAAVVGQEWRRSLQPADYYFKAVHEALITALGRQAQPLTFGGGSPVVILCVGLQGNGKTTSAAKLAHWCVGQGRLPLLVPADVRRPAAIEQLQALGAAWNLRVHATAAGQTAAQAVQAGLDEARTTLCDTVIIDTAGRLHIDEPLMAELRTIAGIATPEHTILVIDAMAGQQGLAAAEGFHQVVPLSGVVLSKTDGDARGGVALSCASVLRVPILFVGTGEKVDALEPFHPDRMASRLLDMGDLASLAERAHAVTDREETLARVKKMSSGRFTLEDFRTQLKEVSQLGNIEGLLGMIPGAKQMLAKVDTSRIAGDLRRKEAIIDSMTIQERANVRIFNGSRRKRVASGSGVTVTDVNRLIKEFEMFVKMVNRSPKFRGFGAT